MHQGKPDLVVSELLQSDAPARKLIIKVADMSSGALTLLEALDIVDASGLDADDWSAVMRRGTLRQKAQLMYAFGWVVARRIEPDLSFDEVCTYQLEVIGEPADSAKEDKRAKTVVAVAALAGVTPDEAEQMTLSEVAAVSDLHKRRQRASRRRAG